MGRKLAWRIGLQVSVVALLATNLVACGSDNSATTTKNATTPAANTSSTSVAGSGAEAGSTSPAAAVPLNQASYLDVGYTLVDCYQPELTMGDSVASHACSWVAQASQLQGLLTQRLPLLQTSFFATHNSFNSTTYPGLSSSGDPNQSLSLGDQLALGMQGLELDMHWTFHAASAGLAPVVCHGLGASQGHFGCTPTDRHVGEVLAELRRALDADTQPNRVLMLDIEDALADYSPPNGATPSLQAHNEVVALIEANLGDLVFRPELSGADCASLDLSMLTKQAVLDAGKKVIIVGGCGVGSAWPSWVFGLDRHQRANDGFDANTCEADFFSAEDYKNRFTRLWQDSTYLGAFTNNSLQPITATDVAAMNRCGLHQVSIDQLQIGDDRLVANIWSWAPGQPKLSSADACVLINAEGRWETADCDRSMANACTDGESWVLTKPAEPAGLGWSTGAAQCQAQQLSFGLPRSAKANAELSQAMKTAGVASAWLNWQIQSGGKVLVP